MHLAVMRQGESLLQEIVSVTVKAVHPQRIVLFGSRARGDQRPDSDLDLLIVEKSPFSPEHRRQDELRLIRQALWDVPVPIDLLLFSEEEVEQWRESPNHVIGQCLSEGVTLYER